jgi:alpha-beta hydrolase superfamily lysophospholipase
VLFLVHGLAEHSGRYEPMASWFAERGSAVHAFDLRGHGLSEGARGHLRNFDEYLDDVAVVLDRVRSTHPNLPIFLVGHSMGGLIVATFARERRPDIAAVVTSGAALQIREGLPGWMVPAARILSHLLPRLRMSNEIDPDDLSRDPEVVRAYIEDPLVFDKITTSLASQVFGAIRRTAAGGKDVRLPMLLLHGGADPICPAEGSRAFHAQLDGAQSRLCIYPELRHEIFNEPEREQVFETLLGWVRERKV